MERHSPTSISQVHRHTDDRTQKSRSQLSPLATGLCRLTKASLRPETWRCRRIGDTKYDGTDLVRLCAPSDCGNHLQISGCHKQTANLPTNEGAGAYARTPRSTLCGPVRLETKRGPRIYPAFAIRELGLPPVARLLVMFAGAISVRFR